VNWIATEDIGRVAAVCLLAPPDLDEGFKVGLCSYCVSKGQA
jgi:hypothetical protein